jgi:hypothetical protein
MPEHKRLRGRGRPLVGRDGTGLNHGVVCLRSETWMDGSLLLPLDDVTTSLRTLIGLAAAVLALGAIYWLMRDQDRRDAAEEGSSR